MSTSVIRVLVVDAEVGGSEALLGQLDELSGVEMVGLAHTRRSAMQQVETHYPDVLLVDLMLTGYRSIEIVEQVAATQPQVRVLALSPADPESERVAMAIRAGALGYVGRDVQSGELEEAIAHVQRGEPWLPLEDTYQILREVAPELQITAEERRNRLGGIVLGILPLSGLIAGITALLWREYWSQIGVRVADLGVDPTTRVTDVFVAFLTLLGVFGPLLFVDSLLQAIGRRAAQKPWYSRVLAPDRLSPGRRAFRYWVAWTALALVTLAVMVLLQNYAPLIVMLFVGPAVGVVLLAHVLGLEDQLPEFVPHPRVNRRVVLVLSIFIVLFLVALGADVWVQGPDLRSDGLHGILAPQVLGFSAKPMILYDLDGQFEPLGALYLGGNADLYVLYDPCKEEVNLVPVGASRVRLVDEIVCP
jgi:DNA-binding NarL/FixJ family response regulator